MDKKYTIFEDKTGRLPTEHRITYSIMKPEHEKYRFCDISFCFDPEKRNLKRLDFLIDDKLLFINLSIRCGVSTFTWYFQKMGSYQQIADEELSLILLAAKDVVKEYPQMPKSFKDTFEVLPRQAKVYKKIFEKSTMKSEKKMLLKALREKNNIIQNVQYRYKKLLERNQEESLSFEI
ncbi:MAG: hypothetical protein IKY15_02040 [Clostridia bacterium]|nr:hypothetical protein [Clostridia bacterium]